MTADFGTALVIGSGISGIRSALDLAGQGIQVTLADQADSIGGILTRLDYQFPTDGCGMCRMLPTTCRDSSSQFCLRRGFYHDRISISLGTTLESLEGEPGSYTALLRKKHQWVDPDRCMGCGLCSEACPVEMPDRFNQGLSTIKAVSLPVPHLMSNAYTIDQAACTRCGACETACPTHAIHLPEDAKKKFRVLVVDDELIVRDSLKEWFEFEGYSVDMAASGAEAITLLESSDCSMVFLDIKMPVMDGTEVLAKVKQMRPDLPVVMMTAYATVETAVQTMKTGAMEYVMKPFDPDRVLGLAETCFQQQAPEDTVEVVLETNAVILSCGVDFFDPASSINTLGYGVHPDVVTGLAFERILSRTGPGGTGIVRRPSDGREPQKIAWFQCIGSRELSETSSFCSSVCCMMALKEAVLARKRSGNRIETIIYYMDMRCFGKGFEAYRREAQQVHGVILRRARPHSVRFNTATGLLDVYLADEAGSKSNESFDMIVLSVGQRPALQTQKLSGISGLPLAASGFISEPGPELFPERGVFPAGSLTGFRDIGESVIQASAAALQASTLIHRHRTPGQGSAGNPEKTPEPASMPGTGPDTRDVSMELPEIAVVAWHYPGSNADNDVSDRIRTVIRQDPHIGDCLEIAGSDPGTWVEDIRQALDTSSANRVVLVTGIPHLFTRRLNDLARALRLDACYLEVVSMALDQITILESNLAMAIARLRHSNAMAVAHVPCTDRVLVAGAGLAGMTAALCIAENGHPVDLVENASVPGGNLSWLKTTLDGTDLSSLCQQACQAVEQHPLITLHTNTRIQNSSGQAGAFYSVLVDSNDSVQTVEHGAFIVATGGAEAPTLSYHYGDNPGIITNRELEQRLTDPAWAGQPGSGEHEAGPDGDRPGGGLFALKTVVMIQCVDSREDTREYCSRVCCSASVKHALELKHKNPDMMVIILYRDLMTYGVLETFYKKARESGILFIRYNLDSKPDVLLENQELHVRVHDQISGRLLDIETDLVVLATGIVPSVPLPLLDQLGAPVDRYAFVQEADSKWQPVDSPAPGIFSCGLALGPRNVTETIASARAAAMRALNLLAPAGQRGATLTSYVRASLCSLCLRCIDTCPYGARRLDEATSKILVNPVLCQGCGACAVVCANSAACVNGYRDRQMFDIIDAVL